MTAKTELLKRSYTAEQSSQIREIEYNEDLQELQITFKADSKYRYLEVPKKVFTDAIEAPSIGSFFATYIKRSFETEKIPPLPEVTE